MNIDWNAVGGGLGAIGVVIMAAIGVMKGQFKSDGKAPVERAPTVNETKAALEALRARIDHAQTLADDDRRDMVRQLDRIERTAERICDRLDADARIGAAVARVNREI